VTGPSHQSRASGGNAPNCNVGECPDIALSSRCQNPLCRRHHSPGAGSNRWGCRSNRGISPNCNRAGLRACRFFTGRAGGPCYQVSREDAGTVRALIGGDDYQLSRSLPSGRDRRLIELPRRGLQHAWRRFEGLSSRTGADAYGGRPVEHRAVLRQRRPIRSLIALQTRPRQVSAAVAGARLSDHVPSAPLRSPDVAKLPAHEGDPHPWSARCCSRVAAGFPISNRTTRRRLPCRPRPFRRSRRSTTGAGRTPPRLPCSAMR
jgi:hypothetical protein